jgi:phosphatidate cytidylyltransferase
MTELQKRVAVAIPGALLLIALLSMGGTVGVGLVVTVVIMGMMMEFLGWILTLPDREEKRYAILSVTWVLCVWSALFSDAIFEGLSLMLMMVFGYYLFTAKRHSGPAFAEHLRELIGVVFGSFYLIGLTSYLFRLHGQYSGSRWTILFLLIVWAGDSAAYFGGKKWGKTKLYPEISPKKTREGALAGLAAGVVVSLAYKALFFGALPWLGALFIPIFVGSVAQIGDLCESFMKRAFDKKDSGSILPGHGGFLDRFDGVVFSAPIMYACSRLLG